MTYLVTVKGDNHTTNSTQLSLTTQQEQTTSNTLPPTIWTHDEVQPAMHNNSPTTDVITPGQHLNTTTIETTTMYNITLTMQHKSSITSKTEKSQGLGIDTTLLKESTKNTATSPRLAITSTSSTITATNRPTTFTAVNGNSQVYFSVAINSGHKKLYIAVLAIGSAFAVVVASILLARCAKTFRQSRKTRRGYKKLLQTNI